MTDILIVLPEFDVKPFTHLLPSLEKAQISTADLLTLDALDVGKRAQLPPGEVKKLADVLLQSLHADLQHHHTGAALDEPNVAADKHGGDENTTTQPTISTLDERLDEALGGGILPGYLTEVVGESAAGKTQFLLTLLLSVQLPSPCGTEKSALYISTEAPLQTTRLAQLLRCHPKLSALPSTEDPSLSRIQSTHIHDVEAQEHILRYQVPVAIEKQNVGLLVIDSIAANYRAEFDRGKARKGAESFAKRSNQLTQLGSLLRGLASKYNIAVVVANQVADRFTTQEVVGQSQNGSQTTQRSRPNSPPRSLPPKPALYSSSVPPDKAETPPSLSTDDPLALDHQQRFFTGWGDDPSVTDLKTPSLGLSWTNQLGTRIALLKSPIYDESPGQPGEDRVVTGWNRKVKVVFSAYGAEKAEDFEIWEGGIRSIISATHKAA